HHGAHAGLDRGHERRQVALDDRVERAEHLGDHVMAVDAGAAVPGKVLGAGGNTSGLQAGNGGGGVPGDQCGVGAEGPGADHRVVGGGVHVHRRSQVQVDAEVSEVGAERTVDRLGQADVVD